MQFLFYQIALRLPLYAFLFFFINATLDSTLQSNIAHKDMIFSTYFTAAFIFQKTAWGKTLES